MKNLTWQNPEQLFVAQELINKVKSKCCGIKVYKVINFIDVANLHKKSENCNFFAAFNKYTSNNSNFTPVQTTSKYRGCHIYYNVRPHARKHIIYKEQL